MPITIVGPAGAVRLDQGCIVAQRHIHMNPDDAQRLVSRQTNRMCETQDGARKVS